MKNLPAENIISLDHRRAVTTSLLVAEKFNKRHKNVLRDIEKMECSDSFTRLNFEPSEYQDSTGRTLPMYLITRDGFTFLAMGFTGKEAATWKEKFISAFNKMEKQLTLRHNAEWQQSRLEGKAVRRELTDDLQRFVQYATAQGSSSAVRYYTAVSSMINRSLGFINEAVPGKPVRDFLDGELLAYVAMAERLCRKAIVEGMTQGMHYKEVYQYAKQRVEAFAVMCQPEPLKLAA